MTTKTKPKPSLPQWLRDELARLKARDHMETRSWNEKHYARAVELGYLKKLKSGTFARTAKPLRTYRRKELTKRQLEVLADVMHARAYLSWPPVGTQTDRLVVLGHIKEERTRPNQRPSYKPVSALAKELYKAALKLAVITERIRPIRHKLVNQCETLADWIRDLDNAVAIVQNTLDDQLVTTEPGDIQKIVDGVVTSVEPVQTLLTKLLGAQRKHSETITDGDLDAFLVKRELVGKQDTEEEEWP